MKQPSRRKIEKALLVAVGICCGAAGNAPTQPIPGVTSLTGQIVDQQGHGLPGVQLLAGSSNTETNAQGQFLLSYVRPGQNLLQIDARHAGISHNADHGFYEIRVDAKPGQITALPYKSWLPLIDHKHDVVMASPTTDPVIIGTPDLPGLELHIPKGIVVKDVDGNPVTHVGITIMPKDHTPFPLPDWTALPVFYTIQPGAACLYDTEGHPAAAQLVYPNSQKELPDARFGFWRYDPAGVGWILHGIGIVSQDGKQVVPDARTVITNFGGSAECDPHSRARRKQTQLSSQDQLRRLGQ
jgi:hypothetical protein